MFSYNTITESNICFTCTFIGKIDCHSWAPECAFLNHERQYFIIEEHAVLETVNAAFYSIISAATPIGVGGHIHTPSARFIHHNFNFLCTELRQGLHCFSIDMPQCACGIYFDKVHAGFTLVTNCSDHIISIIGNNG